MLRRDAIKKISIAFGAFTFSPEIIAKALENKSAILSSITAERLNILAEIADVIIPETDIPGAKAANTHTFIALLIQDCLPPQEGKNCWTLLDNFEEQSKKIKEKSFLECSLPEKSDFLRNFEDAATKSGDINYFNLKNLILQAYFTSEIGATKSLQYDPIPGPWVADMPIPENGKAWAVVY